MTAVSRPTAADFLARSRDGGLFTETISQPVGAAFAVLAHRRGIAPTVLTLGNLLLGCAAAMLVIVAHDRAPAVVVGLVALVLWQVAYALDCADGQLARVTGQASPAGKRIDILCDLALQIALVAAVATVAQRHTADLPPWLVAGFAGTWLVNLVTGLLQQGETAASLLPSGSPMVRVVKLVRDYGAVVTVVGLVLAFAPRHAVWLLVLFAAVNGLFLLVSIAATARTALRA